MRRKCRPRFWVETGLAALTGLMFIVTLITPDWIEAVSGWDPDRHDGSVEWMVAAGLLIVTLAMLAAAAQEWRRAPALGPM
jgi:hypothetical protein